MTDSAPPPSLAALALRVRSCQEKLQAPVTTTGEEHHRLLEHLVLALVELVEAQRMAITALTKSQLVTAWLRLLPDDPKRETIAAALMGIDGTLPESLR